MKYIFLLLLVIGATLPGIAQRRPTYWDTSADSLRRLLAGQRADTTRLRTLQHLVDLGAISEENAYFLTETTEAAALSARLHRPDQRAYRLLAACNRLVQAKALLPARDSLQAAIAEFDRLNRPIPWVLSNIWFFYNRLDHTAWDAYILARLDYYRRRGGPRENLAVCYRATSSHYISLGDYSQAIGNCLRAAELFDTFSPNAYRAALAAAGSTYAEWGNTAKGLYYLRQATQGPGSAGNRYYAFVRIAQINLQRQRYADALQAISQFSASQTPNNVVPRRLQAYASLTTGQVLLAQGHLAEALPLLQATQHLADSLGMHLEDAAGFFELDATWARYYAARHEPARAEAHWLNAYHKAELAQATPLRLVYLHELSYFYRQQQPAEAARYALAALRLTDTLRAAEGVLHVSRYEIERTDRAQTLRIARLRQTQARAEARTRRQRLWLLTALGGLVLLGGGAGLLWRLNRQKQRANTLLARQKAQIEEQAARLGALDEAKNQFFANASHELRTPLTLILGPLDALLTSPSQGLPSAVRSPVALAYRQAQRLQQLVNRILDLTKLQAGRLALHPTPTPLGALLRRVVEQFASLATQRGIALHGPAPLPESLRLLLDADKVEEILTNLLINALNHTPAGGAVHVAVALPAAAGGQYSVTVRDTGPGIAEAEQARVFERFYQSPQSQAQGGTGLGLALSRELAQLLGGSLTLASELGRGAAFTLRFAAEELPAAALGAAAAPEPVAAAEAPLPAAAGAGPRPRVLVVEDQPDLREYLRGLLAPSYEVLLAEDGQAALDLLAHEAPVDLITTDAMMPRVSGTALLARLRADPTQHAVPVLMLTARADEGHRLAALTVGVDDYLTKPFATAELLARVRALLARHQVRRQFAALPPEPEEPQPTPKATPSPRSRPERQAAGLVAEAAPPTRPAEPAAAELLGHWQAQAASRLADEQFGPTELAELLCLSQRTLYRRLGELAGLTPAAWLRELRLTQARRLLEAGGASVAEVADAVGFASPRYFATLYTERFGRRPTDY